MSYWSRSFPGLAENLTEVRQFTEMVLGDAPGADLVVLAVSELAGNAIVHTASGAPGGQFAVHLAAFADRWQVRVDDEGSPTEPHVVVDGMDDDSDWDCESGRGLAMVSSISRTWGVLGDRHARAVWAEIPYPVPADSGVGAVISGGMLDALESVAEALENAAAESQDLDSGVPAAGVSVPDRPTRWRIGIPFDPALAERLRQQASQAAFLRSLVEIAYAEAIGPRPLPYWPKFPNPLALQGASPEGTAR